MQNDKITAALAPTKAAIKARAAEAIRKQVERLYDELEKHAWDAHEAFPYPFGVNSRLKRDTMLADHGAAREWTDAVPNGRATRSPHEPEPRIRFSAEKVAEVIERKSEKVAEDCLRSYAVKMTAKVAEFFPGRTIATAEYNGFSDPWNSSLILISFAETPEICNLSTKIILNRSVLGKWFNQFPTRLVK